MYERHVNTGRQGEATIIDEGDGASLSAGMVMLGCGQGRERGVSTGME